MVCSGARETFYTMLCAKQDFGTLGYEIEMTPTASNVLFGYWSHDIGGNHNGTADPGDDDPKNVTGGQMLLRWVQACT